MRRLLALVACVTVCCAQHDPYTLPLSRELPEGFRTWTSTVGTTVDAKLVSSDGAKVKLEKTDGTFVEVPLSALSTGDQTLVAKVAPTKASGAVKTRSAPVSAPALPKDFPEDPTIDIIPILKKKKVQPVAFTFVDAVSGRTVTSNQLKGKYVYIHTVAFYRINGQQLQDLKLLHEKYASRGFEIISVHPFNYGKNAAPTVSGKAAKESMRKAVEDYGITWLISFPPEEGSNPFLDKLTDENYINWLLDPEGRLIHTNLSSGGYVTSMASRKASGATLLPLDHALSLIFRDE